MQIMLKKKSTKIAIFIVFLILLYALFAAGYFLRKEAGNRFCDNTSINGYDVSGMTLDETVSVLEKKYNAIQVEITEDGETVLSQNFSSTGFSPDREQLLSRLQNLIEKQQHQLLLSLLRGNDYHTEIPFSMDETTFLQSISAVNFTVPRTSSQDAELTYNGEAYTITPEVYGNEFDDSELQKLVKASIESVFSDETAETAVNIEIPEELYFRPEITQDNADLNHQMNVYNKYVNAKITYVFGSEQLILDWDTIKDWIIIDTDSDSIDTEKVYDYVYGLSASYDTIYTERSFTATSGKTITLPSNDYGYRIDKDGEASQLIADITSNTSVEREPIYSIRGYSRNGRNDLLGTYVEVNLTKQHLWFYKDGSLIIETDFVSGLPKNGRETTTGAFPIAYKASPFNLTGGGSSGSDSWDVTVKYWMPFYDGQGLHDASWRSSFGGTIYKTDGSHGCINLPTSAAAVIYEYMEAGIPILLYK